MRTFTILLIFFSPFLAFGQGYTTDFNELAEKKNGATEFSPKKQDSTDPLYTEPMVIVNLGDERTHTNAKITIKDVPREEVDKIRLTPKDAPDTIIEPDEIPEGEIVDLVYSLVSDIKLYDGQYQILYNTESQGVYEFTIQGSSNENPSSTAGGGSGNGSSITDYVGAMANANFIGNNKFLSNVTPIVTLGVITPLATRTRDDKKKSGKREGELRKTDFSWRLDSNPYIGGQIDTEDSVSFIPALMLPGQVGLILNNYLTWSNGSVNFTVMPVGFGLKVIPGLLDTTTVIFQHNFRTGLALGYSGVFLIGAQYTYGFHNATSESERFHGNIFGNGSTDISYLSISGQFYVKSTEDTKNFLFIEWRGLSSQERYEAFTNNAIITVGYRSDLSLTHIFPAGKRGRISPTGAGRGVTKKVTHIPMF